MTELKKMVGSEHIIIPFSTKERKGLEELTNIIFG